MSEEIYHPSESVSAKALIQNMEQYREMYERSIRDPEKFWADEAENFTWFKKWDQVRGYNYNIKNGSIHIEWFKGAETNITVNCLVAIWKNGETRPRFYGKGTNPVRTGN